MQHNSQRKPHTFVRAERHEAETAELTHIRAASLPPSHTVPRAVVSDFCMHCCAGPVVLNSFPAFFLQRGQDLADEPVRAEEVLKGVQGHHWSRLSDEGDTD